jgi:hypothetical protein
MHYRYKRPPRKRAKAAPTEAPAVLTISGKTRRTVSNRIDTSSDARPDQPSDDTRAEAATSPASDDRKPAAKSSTAKGSAIVTARRPGKRRDADAPEVSEEEHRRIGDLADEMKRGIAEKDRQ